MLSESFLYAMEGYTDTFFRLRSRLFSKAFPGTELSIFVSIIIVTLFKSGSFRYKRVPIISLSITLMTVTVSHALTLITVPIEFTFLNTPFHTLKLPEPQSPCAKTIGRTTFIPSWVRPS